MVKKNTLTKLTPIVRHAYQECQCIAKLHYENFPIASFLLPRHLRRSIAAIYAFARTGDDIADEGEIDPEVRLELMTKFETKLYNIQYGKPPTEPIFIALKHTIECFNLPIQLFYDLLAAFRQDILKNRYQNFNEIKDYCHYSANPVGRILLHLAGQANRDNLLLSDNICTGLQLINCIQDITVDLTTKNRCYIPLDELNNHKVNLTDIIQLKDSPNYRNLVKAYIEYATKIYEQGMPLGQNLPGVFGVEMRFIIA
jgi:squalene synthase HpnC